ncbi:SDR family oxidoreductase [Lapillicoccus sp.]|uniref:SDR family NAD(P)-dependent oxidoreductase n=1 Tax=Lapillicoccus sp. TaxID=1909287 RepID=UPI003265702D
MPTVVVTGAGRGLGRAVASGLAADGWDVALLGRTPEDLDSAAREAEEAGGIRVVAVTVDVRDSAAVEAAFATVRRVLGPPAALVVSAGVQRIGAALDLPAADWDVVLDTNLTGAFLCMQAGARLMVGEGGGGHAGGGSIVAIASVAGLTAVAGRAAYAASKAGLVMLTRVCAVEWAEHGIRVNAVAPTFVDTDLGRQTLDCPGERERILGLIPLRRLATPQDVLGAVRFLLDERAAGFVTGECLTVDGGLRA